MKRLIIASLLAGLTWNAQAALIFIGGGTLSGNQEVPPHANAGTGTAAVTVDDQGDRDPNTNLLSWDVTFSGLTSPIVAAHFHGPAQPGQNAAIQVPITDSLIGPPSTSGELQGSANIGAGDFQQLAHGLWYVNVHSSMFPAGETRAQITGTEQIPEPSSMALAGLALLALALPRRRSRLRAE